MAQIAAQLQSLVDDPREALGIEVKRWLDLTVKADQAVLAKAAIALANHGGGFIVLGYEELTDGAFECHLPRPTNLDAYSQDVIARIVATYAEPAFQVQVSRVVRQADGATHPVIQVPGGHRTPVMAKKGSPDQKTLISGRVYIRRPTPESAEPGSAVEWRDLLDRCVRAGRDDLLDAIRGVLDGRGERSPPAEPTNLERLQAWVEAGMARWKALAPPAKDGEPGDPPGIYTVAYQIEGNDLPSRAPSEMLNLLRDVPGYTGWRPWWVPSRDGIRPYQFDGVIECYHGLDGNKRIVDPAHADFWRVNTQGQLLLIRGFDEDSGSERAAPGTAFDLTLPVWRIGECLMHAATLAPRLTGESRPITFSASWSGLRDRELIHLERRYVLHASHIARQDSFTAALTVDSNQISDSLPEILHSLLHPLYQLFDFFELPKTLIDKEVQRMRS
ncbi:RNA-binding domain-containing protein [Lysobacter sp. CCNWLW3]|uniref:AlbA family DNA-binding domain-containing protein n=1 Tax=unclassified Lysobacter TaxID=2635362 RepID=UPI002FD562C6